MKDYYKNLEELLKSEKSFISSDGYVMKNAVIEASNTMDEKLLSLLISDESVKKLFFKEINGTLIFDKHDFNAVLNDKEFLPNSYTRYKQKIGLVDGKDDFIAAKEDVALAFPFKDCILEFDSTDPTKERKEVYFNEVLCHDEIDHLFEKKVLTKAQKFDSEGEHEILDFDENENLLIKGNNLLAMYSLIPRYEGKIKLMYWDVLYNTESDRVPYADSFRHSTWLTMMKNRLEVAKKLLRDDGLILIQCDANEMHYLKVLMDEMFGRENYLSTITCKVKSSAGLTTGTEIFFDCSEYILVYAKSEIYKFNCIRTSVEKIDKNSKTIKNYNQIIYDIDTSQKVFICEMDNIKWYRLGKNAYKIKKLSVDDSTSLDFYNHRNEIFRLTALSGGIGEKIKKHINKIDNNNDMLIYEYVPTKGRDVGKLTEYMLYKKQCVSFLKNFIEVDDENKEIYKTENITNIFYNDLWQGISPEGQVKLSNGKKPERLIQTLLQVCTNENDLILDSYFGTGTTGAVAMKMGRRFIGIEQLDSHIELSKTRLKNVIAGDQSGISKTVAWEGGGSFVYCELMKQNQNYIDEIEGATDLGTLRSIKDEILKSGFISHLLTKDTEEKMDESDVSIADYKKLLIEILDKNQLYVNYSDMEDADFKIDESDKKFTKSFYVSQ